MTNAPGKIKDNWIIEELKAERKRRRIPLRALAPQIGVSKAAISSWEKGIHIPTLENVILWSVALGFHLELTKPEGP